LWQKEPLKEIALAGESGLIEGEVDVLQHAKQAREVTGDR